MTQPETGSTKQILYVEDSSTSQLIVRKYAEKMELGVLSIAPTPRVAQQMLKEKHFDLIITDFLFPEGDAMDFIRHIRGIPSFKSIPIIVVSSSMDDAMMGRVLKAGANDALPKPLQSAEFAAIVQRMLLEPYVRQMDRPINTINCFQWFDGKMYYEFCPELNITLADEDKDRLKSRMEDVLREKSAEGRLLGCITHERVISHIIRD